jgi:hypothetical protein
VPPNLQFLHMGISYMIPEAAASSSRNMVSGAIYNNIWYEVLPEVSEPSVFMMQTLSAVTDTSKELLAYDFGCAGVGLSNKAYKYLETTTVIAGPSVLDTAGGQVCRDTVWR